MIKAGTWVSIRSTILEAGSRADGIPEDTAAVPLMMWVKGYLTQDCAVGRDAEIRTVTNRIERGTLEEVEPATNVDYGDFVAEIGCIGEVAREVLFGGGLDG